MLVSWMLRRFPTFLWASGIAWRATALCSPYAKCLTCAWDRRAALQKLREPVMRLKVLQDGGPFAQRSSGAHVSMSAEEAVVIMLLLPPAPGQGLPPGQPVSAHAKLHEAHSAVLGALPGRREAAKAQAGVLATARQILRACNDAAAIL